MDLTERPICLSSMPPAFMTGQACHIIHSDSAQQCPSWLMAALTQPTRRNAHFNLSLIINAQTHFIWHYNILLTGFLESFKKVVLRRFTEGGNACPSHKCHQPCYAGYIPNDSQSFLVWHGWLRRCEQALSHTAVIRQEGNKGRLPAVSVTPGWANWEISLTYDL